MKTNAANSLILRGMERHGRPWPVTLAENHHLRQAISHKRQWGNLTPAQKQERLEKGLWRPDVKEKTQAARRASPLCSGPVHRANVSRGMKRYWARKKLRATIREARQAMEESATWEK